jgi:hypothetical protein
MTQHEITLLELDKIQNFSTPNFSTYIKWNSKVDTGDVIGFSRLYNLDIYTLDNRTQKTKYIETKSTPPFTIALGNYDKIINNETLAKLTDLILSLIASKFNLSTSNGKYTSLTTVPFDSLDILRQVPSTQVKTLMTNIHNRLDCYIFADPFLKNKLTRKEYEEIQTKADTINSNIPVRSISLPKDIVIVEDWKILDAGRSNLKTTDPPLFKIVKNITAVGIKYDNDKMVYFDYSEIRNNRSVLNIYWPAFEELLRTLVTQKLEIKFYN